jgi:hypothetical protein
MSNPTTIRIKRYGRTGNNIVQNINVLGYGERFGHRIVTLPVDEVLPELVFDFSRGEANGERHIQGFFMGTPEVDGFQISWEEREVIAKRHLADRLLTRPICPGGRTLTIHLRSGDIMKEKTRASNYIQPPMALYRRVIRDEGFERVLVVAEPDGQNPCLKPLEELGATIITAGIGESFSHLLGASHLCFGISTFSATAAILSRSLKALYLGDDFHNGFRTRQLSFAPIVKLYKYVGYIERDRWKATAAQKQLMLDLPVEACVQAQ